MAHRTNIIQVIKQLTTNRPQKTVLDPICKLKLNQRDSKHTVYHGEKTFYFCSKECKNKFVHHLAKSETT